MQRTMDNGSSESVLLPSASRWGPVLLAFYLSSGMLKSGDEPLFGVDLTLLLACAVLLAVAIRIPKATWVRATSEIITLFALFLPAVFWTRWFDYSRDKVLYLFTLTLLAATAPTIILRGAQQLRRFFVATVVVALIVTVSGIR